MVQQHARRTAERDAAHLLPHLRPGMRLLDAGCGPGSITVGLARAVAPGLTVGIDAAFAALPEARRIAGERGVDNARFMQASAYRLPFPDESFDAVHVHQVLQHLARPVDALQELRRALRPGGIISLREADFATMCAWPPFPGIERWLDTYHEISRRNGADADAGRRLPSWLRAAGFQNTRVTATTMLFTEPESIRNWGESWADRVVHSSFAEQALEYGLATPDDLQAIRADWLAWARDPDAFFMYVNVECVAERP